MQFFRLNFSVAAKKFRLPVGGSDAFLRSLPVSTCQNRAPQGISSVLLRCHHPLVLTCIQHVQESPPKDAHGYARSRRRWSSHTKDSQTNAQAGHPATGSGSPSRDASNPSCSPSARAGRKGASSSSTFNMFFLPRSHEALGPRARRRPTGLWQQFLAAGNG